VGIENQQTRLDNLDNQADEKIVVNGHDYADLLIGKVDQLVYNIETFPENIQDEIMESLASRLYEIDETNISEASASLSMQIDAWVSGEAICESEVVVSDEFREINSRFNMSEENLTAYYAAATENNVSPATISQQLDNTEQYFLKSVDEATKQDLLLGVFGKMVNGETENLISNEVLRLNVEACVDEISEKQEEIASLRERLASAEEEQAERVSVLSELVVKNDEWFEFIDDDVNRAVIDLQNTERIIATFNRRIAETETGIKDLSTASLVSQYQFLVNNNEDSNTFVLMMHEQLGDAVPNFVQPAVDQALYNLANNPNASEFEQLFHEGQYNEALSTLVEMNQGQEALSTADIIQTFQRNYESNLAQEEELTFLDDLSSSFPEGSFAKDLIDNDGYRLIQVVDAGANESNLDADFFLVKRLENGTLHYLKINSNGESTVESSGIDSAITVDEQESILGRDAQMKMNLSRLISQKPSFQNLQNASVELSRKIGPLQQLFYQSLEGEKTENFVQLLKGKAREIQGSSAIRDLQSNLSQARSDLAQIRSFANSGIQDAFEQHL